ncbi:hypothetical protein BW731_02260 [Vagococcus martis]|uniref:Cytoplasmic protein n=1 Tax=Vagococcus martis TaxID=1768210 RepID=A0A1V4DFY8_9ENTE|nr:hypothetical protein [Vagococcus martis]OPF87110.1 hypothetical protein BW731_02260 [Vagococcus martis]
MRGVYSRAHKLSVNNKSLLKESVTCGCFYCIRLFEYGDIIECIGGISDDTALCPFCEIDSVLPESELYQLNELFLEEMYNVWFDN